MTIDDDERVRLILGSDEITGRYQNYDISVSIIEQPAAFTLTLGNGEAVQTLLKRYPPRSPFELWIGETRIQSGELDGASVSGQASTVTFKGRDYTKRLVDAFVQNETSFQSETYYELTLKIMQLSGLDDFELLTNNDNARKKFTGAKITAGKVRDATQIIVQNRFDFLASNADPRFPFPLTQHSVTRTVQRKPTVVYNTVKATLGQTWWAFLQEQYKKIGLFLWSDPDSGYFILSEPNKTQEPAYRILRRRGETRNAVNVVAHSFDDDRTGRHAKYIVYGRGGGKKAGRVKLKGEVIDDEMTADGYTQPAVFHDDDIKTPAEAQFVASRRCAEARMSGWKLEYTMSGHRVLATNSRSRAIWAPDTMVDVVDDELGIERPLYIHSVSFRRGPETTTTVKLARPEDLIFAESLGPRTETDFSSFKKATPDEPIAGAAKKL